MSYELNEMNGSTDQYNKKRARIACNSCRIKKIKCDGKQPCSNCINNPKADCKYTERLRRRTKKEILESISKEKPLKNVNTLSDRLSKLEDLIVNFTNKIEHKSPTKKASVLFNKSSPVNEANINGNIHNVTLDKNFSCITDQNSTTAQSKQVQKDLEEHKNSQFIGAHCIISIFSDKSMKWIENALSPSDAYLVNSVKNLPRIVHMNIHPFINKWLNPPKLTKQEYINIFESPFPKNSELVFEFIESQYAKSMLEIICEKNVIVKLFEEYYNPNKKRKFKSSELLLMAMTLALCICCKIDECLCSKTNTPASSTCTTSSIDMMSPDDLLKLHTDLFDKSIFYYHSVSLVHEGLITIQGILFLIIYIETNHIFTFVSFTLISVAMRIAQSLGMHRIESYSKLSPTESARRLASWTCCTFLDIEISFRTGKPPLRSAFDCSPAMDQMINTALSSHVNDSQSHTLGIFSKNNIAQYFYQFELLDRIRFRSYNELFSANTKNKTTDNVIKTLDNLNFEMFKFAQSMSFDTRPILQNDPSYHPLPDYLNDEERIHILKIHLTYFSNLIIINRVPSLLDDTSFFRDPNEISKYRDFVLNAARTILKLNLAWSRNATSFSFYNYSIFHSITGFMVLCASCINHPELPHTYDDIKLLKMFSINVYECHSKWTSKESIRKHFSGLILVSLVLRILLTFAVKGYEYKMNISMLNTDLSLKVHLESLRRECPDIYNDPKIFKVPRHLEDFERELKPHFTSDTDMIPNNEAGWSNSKSQMPYSNQMNSGTRSPMPVSNLLNPNIPTTPSEPELYNEFLYDNDPDLGYLVFSQMTNFPNFFFDNNLGV